MNGGLLIQDCDNHAIRSTHGIKNDTHIYTITSTHHQMQYPYNLDSKDYDILFKSERRLSSYYEGSKIDPEYLIKYGEPEIVLYHKTNKPKCLAVQGHPELIPESPVSEMINNLINEILITK